MSAEVQSLQAQVESVLGALVKAATAELTRLFESRCGALAAIAAAAAAAPGCPQDEVKHGDSLASVSAVGHRRSVGVQVDTGVYPLLDFCGPPFFSNHDCVEQCKEEEEEEEGCPFPFELLLAEDNSPVDDGRPPLKEQGLADVMDLIELNFLDPQPHTHGDTQAEDVLQSTSASGSTKRHKPLVVVSDKSAVTSGEQVKFVCPLILQPQTPDSKPKSLKKSVEAEPQQACASTAKGTAYSPSPSDGALTPAQAGVWKQIHSPKKTKDNLFMKLKLTSPDQKLMSHCTVEVVNVLTVPDLYTKVQGDLPKPQSGSRLPRDLRRHQGIHTGHRLCCFTPCENGIWRLQKIVSHSRDGYTCSICKKAFKHRKILRRHERFHSGDRPYECSMCSKTFALRKTLRRHQRFHTGERPHTCTQCNKSFHLRENLKAHLRFHTGEKPFRCTTCNKSFRIRRNLERHKLSQCGFFVPSFKMIAGM